MQSTNQFLSIMKNFMIDLHMELSQPQIINPEHIQLIDKAVVQLKRGQQNIQNLQNQNVQFNTSRAAINDYKKECEHLQKRINRKSEQIQILKQTVKTLYGDNQKIVKQKQESVKETITYKQQVASLKKKIRRLQQQSSNHKIQLQKLSSLAEEKLNQYLKEDQEKQIKIKKLQAELDKLKHESSKKDKTIAGSVKRIQQFKNIEKQYENALSINQTLKYENGLFKTQLQSIKQKIHDEKIKYLQQNESLLKQIQQLNERLALANSNKQQVQLKVQVQIQKNQSYQQQIVMRTQKLKQKNKQIKVYNEEIQKLAKRVKELSEMADDVINQNRQLTQHCRALENKIQQFKLLYSHVGKLKGEINQKKSAQFGRLIQSISKLQASL